MANETTRRRIFECQRPRNGARRAPVADGGGGTIIATAEVNASPERVFRALTTNEVELWWGAPEFYRQEQWSADLPRVWSMECDGPLCGRQHERRFRRVLRN